MNVTKTLMLTVGAALMATTLEARSFDVCVWRGETTAVRVPDFVELGKAPDGIVVKFGAMKAVKYAPTPDSLQRLEVFDRVIWGSTGPGPRVAEISVPASAKPGVYACGAMNIRVVDRVLPPAKDWKYFLDLWQHPWAVSRYFNVTPFSDAHYEKMRPVWELLASAGQKTITTTILPEAWDHQCCDAYGTMIERVKKTDGTWKFDYAVFDKYVAFCRSCGLGPDICCYTMCPWGYVVRWKDEKGAEQRVVAKPGTKAFEEYWGPFLDDFAKHLESKGWLRETYISMDERSLEDVRLIGAFVRKHIPAMRISMAGDSLPSKYGTTIDDFCMILSHLTPDYLKEAAERRAKGLVTTFYVCCGPVYPNTFVSSAPGEAFWLGAYPAMCGLDGFLRWAWNSWPCDPDNDASYGNWRAGDTFFCYPDGEPSWRFLELRNGIAAAEKVRVMKETNKLDAQKFAAVAALFDNVKAVQNKADFTGIRAKVLAFVNAD